MTKTAFFALLLIAIYLHFKAKHTHMHKTKTLYLALHLVLESVLLSLDTYSGAARKLPLLLPQSRYFSLNVGNHRLAWVSALYILPLNSSSSFENTILDQHHAPNTEVDSSHDS